MPKITVKNGTKIYYKNWGNGQLIFFSSWLAIRLLKNGKLISYPGFPHGKPTKEAITMNKDLLEFFKS